jgi:hypothetical protein
MDTLRRIAQIAFVAAAIGTAGAAAILYLGRGPEALFGARVLTTPAKGPVGMRMFVEPRSFPAGEHSTIYLCPTVSGPIKDCVALASVTGPSRVQARAIPTTWPSGDDVVPATYTLRAGPDAKGGYPARGTFQVVAFKLGPRPAVHQYAGIEPSALHLGTPSELARGTLVCAPPEFMPDGRLAVGDTVYDPATGVTIKMPLGVSVSEMAWSPSGDKLAFITSDRKEIRVASVDGNNAVTKVREARGLLSSLSWAPSGDRFAFIAQDDPTTVGGPGPPTVNIYNTSNGSRTQAGPGLAVAWAPAGDVFAIDRASGIIEVGNAAGGRRTLVRGHEGSWSPDGRFIAYIRALDAGPTGWVANSNGSAPAQVSEAGVCGMSFSASGTAVAMVTTGGGGPRRLVLRSIS